MSDDLKVRGGPSGFCLVGDGRPSKKPHGQCPGRSVRLLEGQEGQCGCSKGNRAGEGGEDIPHEI